MSQRVGFPALFLLTVLVGVIGDVIIRFHEDSELRVNIYREGLNRSSDDDQEYNITYDRSVEHDVIALENFVRNYRHGPNNDMYVLFNHDLIAAYVGPAPKGHPNAKDLPAAARGTIRTWAMFDSRTKRYCDLNAVFDWGQLALFSCPYEGLYRAYAIEAYVSVAGGYSFPQATRPTKKASEKHVLGWYSKTQRDIYNLITGQHALLDVFNFPQSGDKVQSPEDRVTAMTKWAMGYAYNYVDRHSGYPGGSAQQIKLDPKPMVVSDPIRVRESFYCYYWMYNIREILSEGYHDAGIGKELVLVYRDDNTDTKPWEAHIYLELSIWIAEPSAVGPKETLETSKDIVISEYSKVITRRFSKAGLFPCLRKAHRSIEVVKEIEYISETDATSKLHETPHWRALIALHTDRLISTLSDITFTIGSRQNTASFHCFVGDTRVFYKLREFQFVKKSKIYPEDVNLNISHLSQEIVRDFKFGLINIYGHGVHHIGSKWSKKYQPASNRTDVIVITNPCVVQEFALSVGGSLYIATDLLRKGTEQVRKVVLPYFPLNVKRSQIKDPSTQDFVRIFDVAFTSTHVAFLMSDGYVVLHPSSVKRKGISEVSQTMKYRLDAFVKRKWCPRTVSQKLSTQMIPMFGESGNIIILQIFPTEGNVAMWTQIASSLCETENAGFVSGLKEQANVIDETEIHYNLYASVVRTNHITGLVEPPVPSRPPPPPQPQPNILEEKAFNLDSSNKFIIEGEDPHFPANLIDPASHVLENNLKNYNQAKIYIVDSEGDLDKVLSFNGLTITDSRIAAVEFTSEEKEFVFALMFKSLEILEAFGQTQSNAPFQAIVSTLTMSNFPYTVKLAATPYEDETYESTDEKLDTVAPFPGGIFVRPNHFNVDIVKSRDVEENAEHAKELQGSTKVAFVPEINVLGTAIPSYVINLGNVLVFSSVETRYARPIHYFAWDILDEAHRKTQDENPDFTPLVFSNSSVKFVVNATLYDTVVTEQGMISVLRRKKSRHLVQDDDICLQTPDTEAQKVIVGSVLTLEALREIKPFFRNDNIFQRGTPDGEIIYGVYDVKPRSSFRNCPKERITIEDELDPCVEQAQTSFSRSNIPVCTLELSSIDSPCRDPGYIEYCEETSGPNNTVSKKENHACLRKNQGCKDKSDRHFEESPKPTRPLDEGNSTNVTDSCDVEEKEVTNCLPRHAPREDLRTVHMLGTSYHSYLQGSLQEIKSIHPESLTWEDDEMRQEPEICPFASFEIYYKHLDFAEVGYQTRITGEISYFGTGIPTEADLLVEFNRNTGIIVEISSSLEEDRHFTTIRKTIDIKFGMTDFMLDKLLFVDPSEKHYIRQNNFDFEDVRAREPFSVFSLTLRPSIVNTLCKSADFFKTVQFNVGCNAYTKMRLLSEATPLKRINWTLYEDDSSFRWYRDEKNWNLTLPKQHVYYRQIRSGTFACNSSGSCQIPYYHLFKNEIYTISFRDPLLPRFEQFLTVSSRMVTGNVVLYDLLGSKDFNWTINKLYAGCHNTEHFWYDKLLDGTKYIGNETFEHENIYLYYKDCFSKDESQGERELSQNLYVSPFYFFNRTNNNTIKFLRKRNQIFIFRAVTVNTYYNRFTYCKTLDTYFMVRVTGIPIPRQGLNISLYISIFLSVFVALIITYVFFSKFYSGISSAI